MDNFEVIREKIRIKLVSDGYPELGADNIASYLADALDAAGITDAQLIETAPSAYLGIVRSVFGRADQDNVVVLKETYGKVE